MPGSFRKKSMISWSEWRRLKWVRTNRVSGCASITGLRRLQTVWPTRSARGSSVSCRSALGDEDGVVEEPRVSGEDVHVGVAQEGEQGPEDLLVDLESVSALLGHQAAELLGVESLAEFRVFGAQGRGAFGECVADARDLVLAFDDAYVVAAAAEGELVVLADAVEAVVREGRVVRGAVVEFGGRSQIRLDVGDGVGGHVDVGRF